MVVVWIILSFIVGTCLSCIAVVVALSGARNSAYWRFIKRHNIIERLAKIWITALVLACGVMFAYLGFVVAG
jgi:hypothetical protein